jgi:predicted negative regulator of RcsB-dependent stress response
MDHEIDADSNDLATRVLDLIDRARPHANAILAVAVAGLLTVMAWLYISNQVAATRAQSWDAFANALTSDDQQSLREALADVIRRYPATSAAQWAEIVLADLTVSDGTEMLFTNREQAVRRLEAAVVSYASVIAAQPSGMLAERATFGLAKARESLGRLDEARLGYETVAREQSSAGLQRLAAERAASLGRESTRQWYDWFAAQNMAPPQPAAAGGTPAAEPAANPDDAPSDKQ